MSKVNSIIFSMPISRTHIFMFAAVSIFTGMIAPGAGSEIGGEYISAPYAMTNIHLLAYALLLGIPLIFFFASIRKYQSTNVLALLLLLMIAALGIMTLGGVVQSKEGVLGFVSWGWIFLLFGSGFLIAGIFYTPPDTLKNELVSFSEIVIGICGCITFFILMILIIIISQMSLQKEKAGLLEETFGSGKITFLSGITLSPAFSGIQDITFNRHENIFGVLAQNENENIFFSHHQKYTIPERREKIFQIHDRIFGVDAQGNLYEDQTLLGVFQNGKSGQFVSFLSGSTFTFISKEETKNLSNVTISDPYSIIFTPTTGDIFWKSRDQSGERLYKNAQPLSAPYRAILATDIDEKNDWMNVIQDASGSIFIMKNDMTLSSFLMNGQIESLQINGGNSLYVLSNEDGSFSIVHNGIIDERKLDEIREVFLDKNSGGYTYFGRPQGESRYCIFTKYKGNLCGLDGYMNPAQEADGVGVIFAGLSDGSWKIYRGPQVFIKDTGYKNTWNIENDYFFFDRTYPRYFLFIVKKEDGYHIIKQGKELPGSWKNIDIQHVFFGYDGTVVFPLEDESGWRIAKI